MVREGASESESGNSASRSRPHFTEMLRVASLLAVTAIATAAAEGMRVKHPWERAGNEATSPFRDGAYDGKPCRVVPRCDWYLFTRLLLPPGPFTQLTATFLNVVDLADQFGPEDKLQPCAYLAALEKLAYAPTSVCPMQAMASSSFLIWTTMATGTRSTLRAFLERTPPARCR